MVFCNLLKELNCFNCPMMLYSEDGCFEFKTIDEAIAVLEKMKQFADNTIKELNDKY